MLIALIEQNRLPAEPAGDKANDVFLLSGKRSPLDVAKGYITEIIGRMIDPKIIDRSFKSQRDRKAKLGKDNDPPAKPSVSEAFKAVSARGALLREIVGKDISALCERAVTYMETIEQTEELRDTLRTEHAEAFPNPEN